MPTERMLVAAATAAMLASMNIMGEEQLKPAPIPRPQPKQPDNELGYANRKERRQAERGTKKRGR